MYIYNSFSHYYTSGLLPCLPHELRLLGMTSWWRAFLSGQDNGISESSQNSKPMKTSSQSISLHTGYSPPATVQAHALSRCLHCLWCLVETETPPLASAQVYCDYLGMPGVGHRNHPASVRHNVYMTQWIERDRELVNSLLYPPHSGQLDLLLAVHGQSLDGPTHKPEGSSLGHSEGRLTDIRQKTQATHDTL